MEMINANELVYAYDEQDGARRALDGISLTVDKGSLWPCSAITAAARRRLPAT